MASASAASAKPPPNKTDSLVTYLCLAIDALDGDYIAGIQTADAVFAWPEAQIVALRDRYALLENRDRSRVMMHICGSTISAAVREHLHSTFLGVATLSYDLPVPSTHETRVQTVFTALTAYSIAHPTGEFRFDETWHGVRDALAASISIFGMMFLTPAELYVDRTRIINHAFNLRPDLGILMAGFFASDRTGRREKYMCPFTSGNMDDLHSVHPTFFNWRVPAPWDFTTWSVRVRKRNALPRERDVYAVKAALCMIAFSRSTIANQDETDAVLNGLLQSKTFKEDWDLYMHHQSIGNKAIHQSVIDIHWRSRMIVQILFGSYYFDLRSGDPVLFQRAVDIIHTRVRLVLTLPDKKHENLPSQTRVIGWMLTEYFYAMGAPAGPIMDDCIRGWLRSAMFDNDTERKQALRDLTTDTHDMDPGHAHRWRPPADQAWTPLGRYYERLEQMATDPTDSAEGDDQLHLLAQAMAKANLGSDVTAMVAGYIDRPLHLDDKTFHKRVVKQVGNRARRLATEEETMAEMQTHYQRDKKRRLQEETDAVEAAMRSSSSRRRFHERASAAEDADFEFPDAAADWAPFEEEK